LQGGEGDYDEVEYEDEVQDDEEVPPDAPQDEEEKEAAVSRPTICLGPALMQGSGFRSVKNASTYVAKSQSGSSQKATKTKMMPRNTPRMAASSKSS
jgi:hypothetical protein